MAHKLRTPCMTAFATYAMTAYSTTFGVSLNGLSSQSAVKTVISFITYQSLISFITLKKSDVLLHIAPPGIARSLCIAQRPSFYRNPEIINFHHAMLNRGTGHEPRERNMRVTLCDTA